MRKIFTVVFGLIISAIFNNLIGQCNLTTLTDDFCAECTTDGLGVVSGNITVNLTSQDVAYVMPSECATNTIFMGNITIDINNDGLEIPGNVVITGPITFSANGNGRVVTAGGVDYISGGTPSLASLQNLINSACPMSGCNMTLDQILPVELTRFEAQTKDNKVELAWTTATELNNDFFQIEHSRDGIQFQPVGKVKGEGTTTETINYHFMHRQPISGTNYYRLKQVDYDGAFEYSEVVVAEVNTRTGGIQIYPNPTIDKAVIQMTERPEQIKFQLFNLVGQRIDRQAIASDLGWEIDLGQLPGGIYILRLEYAGKTVSKRLVKE